MRFVKELVNYINMSLTSSVGPSKCKVWSMDKDKERGRRLTKEELTKKLSKITTSSKLLPLLKPSQYIVCQDY